MIKIVITGTQGQVGWELKRSLAELGEITAIDVADLDLTNADAVRAYLRQRAPHVLVNPAAYTAVDKAEAQADLAMVVNAVAPGVMAEEMKRLGGLFVHYSTDYVFDGTKAGAWVEEDAPNPLGVYGRSKLAGEAAVRAVGGAHLILRTSWVYGRRGANFLLTMIRLAMERDELRVVADQFGAPTWCRNLAAATVAATSQMVRFDGGELRIRDELSGVYHATDGGVTTWHEFAEAILRMAPELAHRRGVVVKAIRTEDYPVAARRPANSRLDNTKLERAFGVRQESWESALARCLADRSVG